MKEQRMELNARARLKGVVLAKGGIVENLLCAVVAFVMANSFLFNAMAPFGVAFAASTRRRNTLASTMGAVLGYTFSYNPSANVKYIIAAVLVLAIKWVATDTRFARYEAITVPVIAFLTVLGADLTMASLEGFTIYGAVLSVSEAALAAGSTFFMMRTIRLLENRDSMLTMNRSDMSCLIITFAVAMMALGSFTIVGLSVGRIVAVLVILLAAKYGNEAAGAVAGVTAGAAMGMLGGGFTYLAAAYGFGGLVAGMFASFGSFGCAAIFVVVNGVVSLILGGEQDVLRPMLEVFVASVGFALVPGRVTDRLLLARRGKAAAVTHTAKEIMLGKLKFASQAMMDISATTQQVSDKLLSMQPADITTVYSKSVDIACRKCGRKTECWVGEFGSSMDSLNHLGAALKRRGKVVEQDLTGRLADRCAQKDKLILAINAEYDLFTQREGNRHKATQVRGVVTDQFEGMSMMLDTLADELSEIYEVDNRKNRAISDLFLRRNTELRASSSYEDREGRLFVEVELPSYKLARLPMAEVTAELCDLCETNFGLPLVQEADGVAKLSFTERAELEVEFGRAQMASQGGKLCGDCSDFFPDHRGRAHMVVSDGMGSGGKAAIDAAMTVSLLAKLIGAGFEYDAALKMVNSALLVKSDEESLSTIDLVSVDLYTGKTQFLKAGAAPSFVVRGGSVGKVESMSMPAGILRGVEFGKSHMTLRDGDIVVLISDGVLQGGIDWLVPQIKLSKGLSAQDMAQEIADTAKVRVIDSHEDDITVAVLKLKKGA